MLDGQTVYTFIDWNDNFTGSDYPEEYTTTDAAEFQKYIGTHEVSQLGMPLFFQIEDGVEKSFWRNRSHKRKVRIWEELHLEIHGL